MALMKMQAVALLFCPFVSGLAPEAPSNLLEEIVKYSKRYEAPVKTEVLQDMDSIPAQLPMGEEELFRSIEAARKGGAMLSDHAIPRPLSAETVHKHQQQVQEPEKPEELLHGHMRGSHAMGQREDMHLREADDSKQGVLQEDTGSHVAEFLKALRVRRTKTAGDDKANIPDIGPFLMGDGRESQQISREANTESMESGGSPLDLATRNKKGPDYVVRPQGPNMEVYQNIQQNAEKYLDSMNNYNMSPKYSVDQTVMLPPNALGAGVRKAPNWIENKEPK